MQGKLTRASGFSDQLIYINSKSQKPMTLGRGLGGIPQFPDTAIGEMAMTIADYFAIGVLIVLIPRAGRWFLMTYHLSPRQNESTSDQESQQPQTESRD